MTRIFARFLAGILIVLLLQTCAAQRGPSGGPVDLSGPRIVEIEPVSGAYNPVALEEITVYFDELIDPVSVPGSIVFTPPIEYSTRIRGRRVQIRPVEPLAANQVYVLTLQRGIRDYNRNTMPYSKQYVYTTGGAIPQGVVQGKVIVKASESLVEVGLFKPDTAGIYQLYQSLPIALDNSFTFSYLAAGDYRVVVLAGGFDDFPQGINKREYALLNSAYISVDDDTATVAMLMDTPLYEPQISSVAWVTPSYLEIRFDTPFSNAGGGSKLHPTSENTVYGYLLRDEFSDTVRINLGQAYNKLGSQYIIKPFDLPVSAVTDTIMPTETTGREITMQPLSTTSAGLVTSAAFEVHFSEPVTIKKHTLAQLTGRDSTALPLTQVSPFTGRILVANPDRYTAFVIPGDSIVDYVGNTLADSLLERKLILPPTVSTGDIHGRLSNVTGRVTIEALDAASGKRTGFTITDSIAYHIADLVPGFYIIFAHEMRAEGELYYFSGSWEPYQHAARFGYFPEPVEVRARWEVNGIDINFSTDTKLPQL